MGQEIETADVFDEAGFKARLRAETLLVMNWFKEGAFEQATPPMIGAEVEGWLLDADLMPAPRNLEFLNAADDPGLDQELGQYNFELNLDPVSLSGRGLETLEQRFAALWDHCCATARAMDMQAAMIGMPPTLREGMLDLEAMTPSNRYRALNDRVMQLRGGVPLAYEIEGRERLERAENHLMMEAACTSLQTHLMIDPACQARQFNAAMIASAPVLAVSANAPYLYGRRLWEETRIPAFEHAIRIFSFKDKGGRHVGRVDFGTQYVRESLMELFIENLDGHAPLLPVIEDAPAEKLRHFKLQNGTLWRWNRPIVDTNKEGVPHLRIENRITPAGPTPVDMAANAAFFIGLTLHLSTLDEAPEKALPFADTRENFYRAAKSGLGARVVWLDGGAGDVQQLIARQLADEAERALITAGVDKWSACKYMDIIRARARSGMNGATWQRAWVNCNGRDMQGLMGAYLALQQSGKPVHTWSV
ncbi:hypothetical protein NHF45_07280 [Maricaulaceae bacterium NA33B04]|nr:hypothetical protein [Maricaulaceae bacterium NA33B04]